MLYTKESVMDSAGKLQTLEEFVKGSSGGGGSIGNWELVGEIKNIVAGSYADIPEDILDMIENGDYTDICIICSIHDSTTGSTYADDVYMNIFDVFKAYVQTHNFIHFAGFGMVSTFPQQTAPYGFKFDVVDDVLKLWYFGAQYFLTNSVLLDLKFYVR